MYTCAWRHVYDTIENRHTHNHVAHARSSWNIYVYARGDTWARWSRTTTRDQCESIHVRARRHMSAAIENNTRLNTQHDGNVIYIYMHMVTSGRGCWLQLHGRVHIYMCVMRYAHDVTESRTQAMVTAGIFIDVTVATL